MTRFTKSKKKKLTSIFSINMNIWGQINQPTNNNNNNRDAILDGHVKKIKWKYFILFYFFSRCWKPFFNMSESYLWKKNEYNTIVIITNLNRHNATVTTMLPISNFIRWIHSKYYLDSKCFNLYRMLCVCVCVYVCETSSSLGPRKWNFKCIKKKMNRQFVSK